MYMGAIDFTNPLGLPNPAPPLPGTRPYGEGQGMRPLPVAKGKRTAPGASKIPDATGDTTAPGGDSPHTLTDWLNGSVYAGGRYWPRKQLVGVAVGGLLLAVLMTQGKRTLTIAASK